MLGNDRIGWLGLVFYKLSCKRQGAPNCTFGNMSLRLNLVTSHVATTFLLVHPGVLGGKHCIIICSEVGAEFYSFQCNDSKLLSRQTFELIILHILSGCGLWGVAHTKEAFTGHWPYQCRTSHLTYNATSQWYLSTSNVTSSGI